MKAVEFTVSAGNREGKEVNVFSMLGHHLRIPKLEGVHCILNCSSAA